MSNKVRCEACKTTIQSTSRYDFVPCLCGAIFVDGGDDYFRCGYDKPENFTTIYPDGREENMVDALRTYHEAHSYEATKEITGMIEAKDKTTNQLIDEIIEKLRELKR